MEDPLKNFEVGEMSGSQYIEPIKHEIREYQENNEENKKEEQEEKEDHEEIIEDQAPSQPQKYPILFVDINLGHNKIERITIYDGDNPTMIAHDFALAHNLSQKMFEKLQNMLKQQMAGILSRINEEDYDETYDNSEDKELKDNSYL